MRKGVLLELRGQAMKGSASLHVNAATQRGCLKQGGTGRKRRGRKCPSFSPHPVLPVGQTDQKSEGNGAGEKKLPVIKEGQGKGKKCI